MPTVSQLPAQLDAECVAGDPFTISITSTGATITSPTLSIRTGLGVAVAVSPTVSQAGAVTTVAFSAANTAALNPGPGQTKAEYLFSLSALVNGQGPFQLVARSLTVQPVGTAGVATSSTASLAVTVGGAAVSLAVTLGGGGLPTSGITGDVLKVTDGSTTPITVAWGAAPQDVPAPIRPDVIMHAHACAAGHGWTDTKLGGTVDLNYTADFFLGSQSIRLVTSGAGNFTRVDKTVTAFSMTNRAPVVWLKCVSGLQSLSFVQLYLASDTGYANFVRVDPVGSGTAAANKLKEGEWTRVAVPYTVAFSTGSYNRASTVQLRLAVLDNGTGTPVEILFGGFGSQPEPSQYPNGVVSFTFDDGYVSQATIAAPLLDQYGWAATAYVVQEAIDQGYGMSVAQLRAMELRGWDIGAHAYSWAMHDATGGATGVTQAALELDLDRQRSWLWRNGFKSAEHWAYPQGFYNATVLEVARQRFTACVHTRSNGYEAVNPGESLRLGRFGLGSSGVSLASAQTRVTGVAGNKGWQIFMLHKLDVTATDAITWATSDFAALLASCASAGVAVKTISEVVNSAR